MNGKTWARILIMICVALSLVGAIIALVSVLAIGVGAKISGGIMIFAFLSLLVNLAISGAYTCFLYFNKNVDNYFKRCKNATR